MKILHIGSAGAIMIPFVEFVNQNFTPKEHVFMLNPEKGHSMPESENVFNLGKLPPAFRYFPRFWGMYRAEKIILHGIFDGRLLFLLMLQPWLLRKCHWAIWGGDLYDHQLREKNFKWKIREFFKKHTIRKFGHFITHIRGDYELAKKWYGAVGKWHDCFMYPSNLYRAYPVTPHPHDGINILLGNSASSSNNHLAALENLRSFAGDNIKIYCPLSYGDTVYGDEVAEAGKAIFGEKFIPIREFMPFENYIKLLSEIDVAIFNHNRQQGLGNITTLLGLGKTVYMRADTTTWHTLTHMGLALGDSQSLELRMLPSETAAANRTIIANRFSERVLINQFRTILED